MTSPRDLLTQAERAILHGLAAGHTNAQIGEQLFRSAKTVRNQLTSIYAKLGVANRAEAVAVHVRMGVNPDQIGTFVPYPSDPLSGSVSAFRHSKIGRKNVSLQTNEPKEC
jgi:DNA-binding CsgD family transcriptional regulator